MPSTIHVSGVGQFAFQPGGDLYRHYVHEVTHAAAPRARVIAYLDGEAIHDTYADHIRRVVDRVLPDHPAMLCAARLKIRDLMTSYGLDVPEDFAAFADSLQLTHVKPYPDGGAELIFGTCPWFPNFDLNVALDSELAIARVWFDG